MTWMLMVCEMWGEVVPGPRGPVGPDVPLSEGERTLLARCIAVEGYTADDSRTPAGKRRRRASERSSSPPDCMCSTRG